MLSEGAPKLLEGGSKSEQAVVSLSDSISTFFYLWIVDALMRTIIGSEQL